MLSRLFSLSAHSDFILFRERKQQRGSSKMNKKKLLIRSMIVVGAVAFLALLASGTVSLSGLFDSVALPIDGFHP
jgi:hypothetical protein